MEILGRKIGESEPCYIIAELSANHAGSLDIALDSIRAIAKTGADAVKIQSYTPDSITLDLDEPLFKTREDSPWAGQKLYSVYEKGQTPWEWHQTLKDEANRLGLDFFSSPFDLDFVDKLESLDVPAYKIASLEINHVPLIRKVLKTGKPVIFSTGAANKEDIDLVMQLCKEEGNDNVAILKCTSAYPTPLDKVDLSMIPLFRKEYNIAVGLSDHTLGSLVAVGAVALGACIVEKHFILNKNLEGALDKDFSLDPDEFTHLVNEIRDIEKAIGKESYDLNDRMKNASKFRRSIFVSEEIKEGDFLSEKNIKIVRPGQGLHPQYYESIIGKEVKRDLAIGTPLSWSDIEK